MAKLLLDQSCREPKSGNCLDGLANNSLKKIRNGKKGIFMLACMLLSLVFSTQVEAQTPMFFKTGTTTAGNTIPLNQASQKTQLLYTPTDFSTTPTSGEITKIYFRNSAAGATATFTDFKVSFIQNNDASFPSTSFYTGLTPVHFAATQTVTGNATAGDWFEIPLQAPYFQYDNTQTLIIEIQYTAKTGGISTTHSPSTGNKRLSGTSLTSATGTASTTWNNFGLDIVAATPCTGAPTAGTATTNITDLCPGSEFTLNLSGVSTGSGLTFQWQTSPNGTTGWTPVGPSSSTPIFTTSQTPGTHFYQAVVTCGSQTATSSPVSVTSPALPSGHYTIDNNAPASSTNFQSFTAAINSLNCGISGPVTFNVAANSGPYNEQIEITEITGASATNPITFQGNGRTISADPVTGNRAVIKLNGADYVTINNLNIETTGTSTTAFGWGIHFIGGADNNTISNNNITIGSLSITASNSVGIVFANSTSTATTVGNNGNNNMITGNTIIGGYRGIRLNGTATGVGNNQIVNNTIRDFYTGGIEIDDANATLIEGNDISRPNRQVVIAFDGIALSGTTINTIINKNRIHNSHGAATTLTTTAYGISSTSNDAAVGSENIVKNNLIYNLNNTGTVNGIHNTGSNGIFYYNNTINLDNAANTAAARGFYQSTSASNIKFVNNNVVVNTGGIATNQHAIYLNTPASTVESNFNNLYVPNGTTGYHSATQYVTLADWQTANSGIYDLNSVAADPFFVSAATGNLTPTNGILNNAGQPLAAVTNDFTGAPRGTTPDIGAYEFTPSTLDIGVTALVSPVAKNCFGNVEPVTVTVTNFGTAAVDFSTLTANVTVNVSGAATPAPLTIALTNAFNGGQPLAPAATMNVLVGNVNMTAAGTYTFNAATAVTAGGSDGNTANNAMAATDVVVSPLAPGTASASNTNLCLTGVTTLNLTGNTGGDVQWQSGPSATGPFTNIAGATSASFTLPNAITQTTFYQAVVSCGTNNATSNVVTINVSNPAAPTVAPVTRCGAGPVTLTATAPAGATFTWYDAATGGTPLATGTTFSPNVTATTTYYASANVGGVTENVGIVNGGTSTFISAATGWGLRFTATVGVTINSVNVYATGTGTIAIKITDLNDVVLYTAQPVTITGATTAQKLLIPVNLSIPPGNYKMGMTYTGITALVRESSGVSFPYTSPSGAVSITAGSNGAGSASTTSAYYWFYDWNISTGCESARTPVVATVTAGPATPTITAAGPTTFCTGGSVVLTAASTTTGATYEWFLNGTAITGATSATYTANAAGNYTVVASAGGCSSAASTATAVTVNTAAATPTITAGGPTTFCSGDSVTLTAASTTTGATYEWFLDGTAIAGATSATYTANAAGNYTVIATASGCPSVASAATAVTVNATPATPTVTRNGAVLNSSAATGNQWFLDGMAIPGATGATHTATSNGTYTVVVTGGGCDSDPSAPLVITNLSAGKALAGTNVQVYPNPANGSFNVKLQGYQKDATVVLYNLAGQQITTEKVTADGNARNIDIRGLAAGTYLLKITSDKNVQVTRLVVE